jgi:hypothetical protein
MFMAAAAILVLYPGSVVALCKSTGYENGTGLKQFKNHVDREAV